MVSRCESLRRLACFKTLTRFQVASIAQQLGSRSVGFTLSFSVCLALLIDGQLPFSLFSLFIGVIYVPDMQGDENF